MIKYTTKEGMFETDNINLVPFDDLHSLNDNPALILDKDYSYSGEFWFLTGLHWLVDGNHPENGPAIIYSDESYSFWLNGQRYKNINDWLENHPNKDITFQAIMRLKYN